MSKSSSINIRVDTELKAQAEQVMSELGLNMTTAVNMFLKQIVREQAIPLSLSVSSDAQVLKDLLEARLARAHGYAGKTGSEVADELDLIIAEAEHADA